MNQNEIYHFGKLGMKWGIRRKSSNKVVSKKNNKSANLEKARAIKKENKVHSEEKKIALEKGSASDILKFKGELSNTDMQNALTRINLEKQLSDISTKEIKSGMDKVNSVMNKIDQTNSNINKAINAYNTIAKVNNSLSDKQLPTLDGTNKKEKNSIKKKKHLVKNGTPEEIIKNFGKLDVKDLEDISKRFSYEDLIRKKQKKD